MRREPSASAATADFDLELLKDLERRSLEELHKLRAFERVDTRIRLVIQAGDSSRLNSMRVQAFTSDVSDGGCCVVSTHPVGVGDLFRLTFDSSQLELPLVFARCVRCRILREDAFEAAFAFFDPVSIERALAAAEPPSVD